MLKGIYLASPMSFIISSDFSSLKHNIQESITVCRYLFPKIKYKTENWALPENFCCGTVTMLKEIIIEDSYIHSLKSAVFLYTPKTYFTASSPKSADDINRADGFHCIKALHCPYNHPDAAEPHPADTLGTKYCVPWLQRDLPSSCAGEWEVCASVY